METAPTNHNSIPRISRRLGKHDLVIENELFLCHIYWARIVGSETESLFTQYTKHTFYEIQYALEGQIIIKSGDDTHIVIDQSHFTIIPPDMFHQIVDGDDIGARFIMAFSLEIKHRGISDLVSRLSVPRPYPESPAMRAILENLSKKNYHDEPIRRNLIARYLEVFMLEMIEILYPYRISNSAQMEQLGENEIRIMEIQQFIADHNGIGIQVCDIAKKFGISERHLSRLFISTTGKSPKEAINRQKLEKMEELIASTKLSFREISKLCGFSDEFAMSKFFKRYTLYTLTEYRALRESKNDIEPQ